MYYLNLVGRIYYTHIICVLRPVFWIKSIFIKTVVIACGYLLQAAATEANASNLVGLLTSPAQNNFIMCRIKLVVGYIALVYSHKIIVVIVTLLAFVMIYNTVILVNPAAAFKVKKTSLFCTRFHHL